MRWTVEINDALNIEEIKGTKGGHSKKTYFLSTLIKTLHQVGPLTKVLAQVQVFLVKLISKEAQIPNIAAIILNSTQKLGRVFVPSFRPRDFVQMALEEPFNYHSGFIWLLLSHMILIIFKLAPNSDLITLKIVTWIIAWKRKKDFARSASPGACNYPIFLSRRFHRPIYF